MKKRIVILGSGESGTGAAILAKQQGFDVFVSDQGSIKDQFKKELDDLGIGWEENQHSLDKILNALEVIKSPGIPEKAEVMKAIRSKGIQVIGEKLGVTYQAVHKWRASGFPVPFISTRATFKSSVR